MLRKLLSWITTPLVFIVYAGGLYLCQLVFVVLLPLNKRMYMKAVYLAHGYMLYALAFAGFSFRLKGEKNLPTHRSCIIVSNHQSVFDIPALGWVFRHQRVKFVAKKELGKWIPGVSHALRNMGSLLIDRAEGRASLAALAEFGKRCSANTWSASIFPEGTRSRDGRIKAFKQAGLLMLIRNMPGALVVPVAISGSYEFVKDKFLPIPFGRTLTMTVLSPIEPGALSDKELAQKAEEAIRQALSEVPGGSLNSTVEITPAPAVSSGAEMN